MGAYRAGTRDVFRWLPSITIAVCWRPAMRKRRHADGHHVSLQFAALVWPLWVAGRSPLPAIWFVRYSWSRREASGRRGDSRDSFQRAESPHAVCAGCPSRRFPFVKVKRMSKLAAKAIGADQFAVSFSAMRTSCATHDRRSPSCSRNHEIRARLRYPVGVSISMQDEQPGHDSKRSKCAKSTIPGSAAEPTTSSACRLTPDAVC